MYRSDTLRQQVAKQAGSVEDFLRDLQMTAQVGRAGSNTLERIHQLIQKTNQFNLTTRRHNLDADPGAAWPNRLTRPSPLAMRLADRYGDLGLVCVGILERLDEKCWVIDTLLMSCRVMGRNVEDAFLSYLAELATRRGARLLRGILRPTAKNLPVRNFYPEHGFSELDEIERRRAFLSRRPCQWGVRLAEGHRPCTTSGAGVTQVASPVEQRTCQIVAEVFGLRVDQVTLATSHETIEDWDSLNLLNVLMAIEGEFNVTVAPEEAAEFVSVRKDRHGSCGRKELTEASR